MRKLYFSGDAWLYAKISFLNDLAENDPVECC